MALTFFDIKAAAPRTKPFKLSDGDGLYLLVQPNGHRFWRFRSRPVAEIARQSSLIS